MDALAAGNRKSAAAADALAATSVAARRAAYGYGVLVAAVLGYFLWGLPIQVSDSFGNMLKLSSTWGELFYAEFTQQAFLRPMLWAELKLVHDLSGGDYFAWFRGTHVVQAFALVLLYLALVRPRSWADAAVVPFGLAVLVGMHTFAGTVREAFPINTYMTLLICCFAAAVIALSDYRWWNDVAAAVIFVVASLTVETGLLVWVIFVGAALAGARGVSRGGLAALMLLFAAYFYLRFGPLEVGSPDLLERSSGFGFRVLEPSELAERFGANPAAFYAYNVAASALSVLFSEPSAGVFGVTRAAMTDALRPAMIVNVVSTAAVTLLVAGFVWTRRRGWLAWRLDRDDRIVFVFGGVLAANAVISYPYTKDVIMSPSGALFAAAAFVAARHALVRLSSMRRPAWAAGAAVLALAVSAAWAVRVEALHAMLRQGAVVERLDWAYIESGIADGDVLVPDARARALLETLRRDALLAHPAPPALDPPLARILEGDD